MNNSILIADAPTELLLGLGIFFCLAALALFILSIEAGNYRDLSQWLREVHRLLPRNRARRRWYFNTASQRHCIHCHQQPVA